MCLVTLGNTVTFSSQVILAPAQTEPEETHVPQTQESPETAASFQAQTQPLTCPQVRLLLAEYDSEFKNSDIEY